MLRAGALKLVMGTSESLVFQQRKETNAPPKIEASLVNYLDQRVLLWYCSNSLSNLAPLGPFQFGVGDTV